ncbi:MAG: hypothetical protein Kow0098_02070 [Ignavibacteriaceae bacterium]
MEKNRISSYIISVLIFVIPDLSAQEGWHQIASPTDNFLRYLYFADSYTGWAGGGEGTIIKTTNEGKDWHLQQSNVNTFIRDIYFLDHNFGWAITIRDTSPFGTEILRTSNGGDEWIKTDYPEINVFFNAVIFFDTLNGLLGGDIIARTTDGGLTWTESNLDSVFVSTLPKKNFKFYNSQYGFACGGSIDVAGVIWKTTDGGINWRTYGVAPEPINDMLIIDSLNILALSGDPEGFFGVGVIRSSDAGETWDYEELTIQGLSFGLDSRNKNEIWSASALKFLHSEDGGISWTEIFPDSGIEIYDLTFPSESYGIAVGLNGVILRYSSPTSIDNKENIKSDQFTLFQNYPNPFNPTTVISWQTPVDGWQSLKIYDLYGSEVVTLVDEYKPAGRYEAQWNADGYASGVYFYQLKSGRLIKTKKLLFVR